MNDQQPTRRPPTTGPSRDMIGGPWLGLIVFIIIALGMAWGVTAFFQMAKDNAGGDPTEGAPNHSFEIDAVYITQQDLLIGLTSKGVTAVFPDREHLPRDAPNRRSMPTVEQVRGMDRQTLDRNDLLGVVERGTAVRVDEVILDPNNPQTEFVLLLTVLDGEFRGIEDVLGLHLEGVETEPQSGERRYHPRADLLAPVADEPAPVQSPPSQDPPEPTPADQTEPDHAR